jgi:signal transduction histidine kinase
MEVASAAARIGRIASIWAHDVQAPTFRVRLLVDMLRPRLNDKLNKELLERIYRENSKISEIIPGLPDRHEIERVDLNDVIDEVKRKKEDKLLQRNVHLKADLNGIPPISGNSRWMVWILIGLLNNAVRFMPEGGTITISGRLSNKRVLLDVIDTGPGLTDSVRNQLFLGKVIDPQSNGRGWQLLFIKDVLNDYSADLILPRKDESPNVFTLDLPLAPDQEVQN